MTKRKPTVPGAQALLAARREAAKELGLPLDHWITRQLATLKVAHDDCEAAFATGTGDIDSLLKVSDAMQRLRAIVPPPPMPDVGLKIVQRVIGIYTCKHCGKRNELEEGTYTPAKSKHEDKLSRTIDLVAEKPADATAARLEGGTMIPPAPKPEPKPEKLFEPAHDFHAGAPLRNGNEPWRNR
jgi:hypothetical protein